jgi:hypothetical protein
MENTLTRKPGLIMGLLVVLGAMLRLLYITKPVMYDEAWTYVDSASQPIWWFTTRYASNSHLLNTWLIHLLDSFAPMTPVVLRLPTYVFGVLCLWLTYRVARHLYRDEGVALLALGLVAVNGYQVFFSVNARGYTMLTAFFLLALWSASHFLADANRRTGAALAVSLALGFYAHLTMLYVAPILGLWLLIQCWQQDNTTRWSSIRQVVLWFGVGALLTLALYSPFVIYTIIAGDVERLFIEAGYIETGGAILLPEHAAVILPAFHTALHAPLSVTAALPLMILALISVWGHWQRRKTRLLILQIVTPLALITMILLTQSASFTRTWIILVPIYSMWIAFGLRYILRQSQRFRVAGILLVGLLGFHLLQTNAVRSFSETGPAGDVSDIANYMHENMTEPFNLLTFQLIGKPLEFHLLQDDSLPLSHSVVSWPMHGVEPYLEVCELANHPTYIATQLTFSPTDWEDVMNKFPIKDTHGLNYALEPIPEIQDYYLGRVLYPGYLTHRLFTFADEIPLAWFGSDSTTHLPGISDGVVQVGPSENWEILGLLEHEAQPGDQLILARLQVLSEVPDFDSVYISVRSTEYINDYLISLNIPQQAIGLSYTENGVWGGFIERALLPDSTLPVMNEWFDLEIELQGPQIDVALNGTPILSLQDDRYDSGTLSLLAPPNGSVLVDNVSLYNICPVYE